MRILEPKNVEESIDSVLKSLSIAKKITEVEKCFHKKWQELGRLIFESHMQEEIDAYEKTQKGSRQRWSKNYQTRFGEIRLKRRVYCENGSLKCRADEHFGLPENGWLPTVEKLASVFGIEMDFCHAAEILEQTTGVKVKGHTLANHVEQIGAEMAKLQKAKSSAEIRARDSALKKTISGVQKHPIVYAGCDGIMVPLNNAEGYKEALVGVIFWEESHQQVSPKRNEIRHRHYVASLEPRDSFSEQLFKSFSHLVGTKPCQVVAIGDGAHWIWEQFSLYYPDAIQILDFFHLSEYVWNVAKEAFTDKESQDNWVNEQLTALKESRASDVLSGLRFFANRKAGKVKDAVHRLKTYLQNNLSRIDYARYLEMGLMIGSGVVESSNRRVVTQRLKQAGMHWSRQGADSMMTLRAAYLSSGSQWRNFWRKREAA